jgi:hypothetical protein
VARERRKRRIDPVAWALWAQQRREDLPPGIPFDYFGDVCTRLDVVGVWGCEGRTHSLAAVRKFISETDFDWREDEVLAWLERLGGNCDCTVQARAYKNLLRLSRLWEKWESDA